MFKLQGSTVVDGCNSYVVRESGAENLVVSREKTMLWHQRLGHIGEKGLNLRWFSPLQKEHHQIPFLYQEL